jgi:hypothetical protein
MKNGSKIKSKKNKKAAEKDDKKRRSRHQFRSTYRERAKHSFAKAVLSLHEASEGLNDEEAPPLVGLNLLESYRSTGHSLEMLSKEVLERTSPFLTLTKLEKLDDPFSQTPDSDETTCVGRVALARASKLWKTKTSKAEIGLLDRIIDKRNACEHRSFGIKNLQNSIKEIIPALVVIKKVYDDEFRDASLLLECEGLFKDVKGNFEQLETENSKGFEKSEKAVAKAIKQNKTVITCLNCFYKMALLDDPGESYKCLWCEDERKKVKCSFKDCGRDAWVVNGTVEGDCGEYHLNIKMPNSVQFLEKIKGYFDNVSLGGVASSGATPNSIQSNTSTQGLTLNSPVIQEEDNQKIDSKDS